MRYGVSLWLWTSPVTNEVIESLAPKVAALGFDTLELPLEDPESLDTGRARKAIEAARLNVTTCAAMGPGRDLVHPDTAVREATMQYMTRCLQAAAELGAAKFVGPLYAEVGRLWQAADSVREAELDRFVGHLKALCGLAERLDVTICIEALNRFESSFLNLTSQVVDVVDRVDHARCKAMIDLFHAGIEEKDLGDAIRLAGARLAHMQVAENDRGTPGTGQLDWPGVAAALAEIGYDGDIVIETFSPDNALLAKAAAIWRPLAESPDRLAADGLAFLGKLMCRKAG
jgi:D-psicose/D-tagatose/L-ribulose 3-epimerase